MTWRRLRAGELDHEALWLGVSLAAAGVAWSWTQLALPTPHCPVRAFAGFPCPTCGATRCVVHLFHGAWGEAFAANPLVFAAFLGIALFDLYALAVLLARSPRWRWTPSARGAAWLRGAVVAAVLVNWAWLLRDGR
jgi:hypothetical protein